MKKFKNKFHDLKKKKTFHHLTYPFFNEILKKKLMIKGKLYILCYNMELNNINANEPTMLLLVV